jgi:hypothetical protein
LEGQVTDFLTAQYILESHNRPGQWRRLQTVSNGECGHDEVLWMIL